MRYFCILFLKALRYKIDMENIPSEKKYVLLFAPHTSWSDFLIGKAALTAMGIKTVFLIKKEAFFFPMGILLRWVGGYPVDRQRAANLTTKISHLIKEKDEIALLIAPEGTRGYAPKWKKGFYYIAQKAEVPIALGYLDYETKKGGIGPVFYTSGDYSCDLETIQDFYNGMCGRRKGKFNLEDNKNESI